MRLEPFLARTCLASLTVGAAALGQSPLSGLDVLQDDFPKSFFYWTQTHSSAIYTTLWNCGPAGQFDPDLGAMNGAMINPGSPYGPGSDRYDAFTAFGQTVPEQLQLMYASGKARRPDNAWKTFDLYFPGHWAYLEGQLLGSDLLPGTDLIQLAGPPCTHFEVGDDVILYRIDPMATPEHDWTHYEEVEVLQLITDGSGSCPGALDLGFNGLRVARARKGTCELSFTAGETRVAPHAVRGPFGDPLIDYWEYNFSTECPPDENERRAADVYSAELANIFSEASSPPVTPPSMGLTLFQGVRAELHGIEFDVPSFREPRPFNRHASTPPRSYDFDNDGNGDNGLFHDAQLGQDVDAVARGFTDFLDQLRGAASFQNGDRLILVDGQGKGGARPNGRANGAELEGFVRFGESPPLWSWSTGVNQLAAWQADALEPALNYVNLKMSGTDWGGLPPNVARYRAVMGVATIHDFAVASYHNLLVEDFPEPGQCVGLWDEMMGGTDFMQPNWLGESIGGTVHFADDSGSDLLKGAGIGMGDNFQQRFTFSNASSAWTVGPGSLTVTPLAPGGFSATFCSPMILDPAGPGDLVVYFDVQGRGTDDVLDSRTARRLTIELLNYDDTIKPSEAEVHAWVLGHDPAASAGPYLRVQAYWRNVDVSGSSFDMRLSVDEAEGLEFFRIKRFRVAQEIPVMARAYENGAVLVNPGMSSATIPLSAISSANYRALTGSPEQRCVPAGGGQPTAQEDWRCPEVNDGTVYGNGNVTLGGRDAIFLRTDP